MREAIQPIIEKLRELEDMIRELEQRPEPPSIRLNTTGGTSRPLHDVQWAADYLDLSPWKIYDLVRREAIPYVRVGSQQFKFSEDALAEWIAKGGDRNGARSKAEG